MPSAVAKMMNEVLKSAPKQDPDMPRDYVAEREKNNRAPLPRCPKNVKITELVLNGVHGEKLEKSGNGRGAVLYIHGGGFTGGSARNRRGITQYIADTFGYNVYACDYRLAPENIWPAQPEDCLAFYLGMLDAGTKPEDIILMGESAGGTLVLSLPVILKERGLPMPKASAALSPCTTQAENLPSHSSNISTDYMLGDSVYRMECRVVFGPDYTEEQLREPSASPLYADFAGLPPVFLSASDSEALLDDSRYLYEKLIKAGHRTQLDIQSGVCHAFHMFPVMPEAKESLRMAFEFIDAL